MTDFPPGPDGSEQPSVTPNVVLANPVVRKAFNWVVGLAAIIVPVAVVIDASAPELDWSSWTNPAAAATSLLAGMLGVIVTIPNIPRTK